MRVFVCISKSGGGRRGSQESRGLGDGNRRKVQKRGIQYGRVHYILKQNRTVEMLRVQKGTELYVRDRYSREEYSTVGDSTVGNSTVQ